MFFFSGEAKFWLIVVCAAILRATDVLGFVTTCDGCSCDRVASVATTPAQAGRTSILFINCTKIGVFKNVPIPNIESYNYTEIRAEFQRNKIPTIQYAIFKGLPITHLNLANNEIRNVADGSFSKMPTLKELNLSNNKLMKSLNSKMFQGLEKLEVLDLSANEIMQLDSTVFYYLESLKTLKLCMNFFKEIPSDLFISVRNLEILHLHQNALTSINEVTFHTLEKLKYLDISGNNIEVLDEDMFEVSTLLTTLDLSSNNLTSLSTHIFKMLKNLQTLNISKNQLGGLGKEFHLPRSLQVLDIGHNKFRDPGLLFQNFDDLRELHAEDNSFDKIDVITALTKLQILNVSSNILKSFPLQTYPLLRVLDISNNLFSSIPPVVTGQYLPSLNHLSLDANPIHEIAFPPTKSTFRNLTYVSLSKLPALREIPARAFTTLVSRGSSRLVEEAVESEELTRRKREDTTLDDDTPTTDTDIDDEVEDEDEDLMSQEDEDESKEGIISTSVSESTKEIESKPTTAKTESSTIQEKEIFRVLAPMLEKELTAEIGEVKKNVVIRESKELTSKDLEMEVTTEVVVNVTERDDPEKVASREEAAGERNVEEDQAWTAESDGVQRLGSLRKEMVAVSAVREYENVHVEAEVKDCRNGLTLRVAMNTNLMKIHPDAFKGVDICELDLNSNCLTSLPENVLDWSAVRSVDLQGNPWDCSCKLQWLLNVLVPKMYKTRPELLYELRCATPAPLFDRRFVHFFNWTEPAFCIEHKFEQIKKVINGTEIVEEKISFGSSNGMLIAIGIALMVVVCLVAMGVYYQWRVVNKRSRMRNRRK